MAVKTVFVLELCRILFLFCAISKATKSSQDEEEWLENDSSFLDRMQGDQPVLYESQGECPPAPQNPPRTICALSKCETDADCTRGQKCCDNGCITTCLDELPPPAVVDWLGLPPTILKTGHDQKHYSADYEEICSTSEYGTDAEPDPLLCPNGYYCHIEDKGDPINGIDNRGRCIPIHNHKAIRHHPNKKISGECKFHGIQYSDGSRFYYAKHICECKKSELSCVVEN